MLIADGDGKIAMNNNIIYFTIALIASSVGSLLGIGGGIIIVPALLSAGITKELVSANSSLTVFTMAAISSFIYIRRKQGDIKTALFVAMGSIPGSYLGVFLNYRISTKMFNILFAFLLILLLILMFLKNRLPNINLGNVSKVFLGLFIGILSGLFGIGGGPITVPLLLSFFGFQGKTVSATSIYITMITALFSVLSNIFAGNKNLSLAIFMIPGAIIGAKIGTYLNKKAAEKTLNIIFNCLLIYLLIRQFV
ncbi:integral membrane [Thermoanaerobacterium thermosaccharolyticum]|uniref:Probable membrane transporter protein n=1 Tax=Thermoanaerobacterium thermosaccharolyticum TaxID=1517 RepID=A0A223HX95_THETR|nr:sulfite exporter TauE/SafE family protein [Thermoanaerobacterium thermosaccharolyticum]AST57106.1 integral membrane [Thermoanaerobacterium thermosaccharolyticum]